MIVVLFILVVNVGLSFIISQVYPSHCVRLAHEPIESGPPEPGGPLEPPSPVKIIRDINTEELEVPPQLFVKVDTPLLPLAEKDIIVRSAYVNFHEGAHDSEYQNSTIILLEIKKSLLSEKALEKCGVGEYVSSKFEVITYYRIVRVFLDQSVFCMFL